MKNGNYFHILKRNMRAYVPDFKVIFLLENKVYAPIVVPLKIFCFTYLKVRQRGASLWTDLT